MPAVAIAIVRQLSRATFSTKSGASAGGRALRPLQAAVRTYRIAFGPRTGQKVLTVQSAMPKEASFKQTLCADVNGLSVHAAVRCGTEDRQALEQLCRYITRPALANERIQCNPTGQVVLKLKTPWCDGNAYQVMSPLEFMQRHIEWQLCGSQTCECYVGSGSRAGPL